MDGEAKALAENEDVKGLSGVGGRSRSFRDVKHCGAAWLEAHRCPERLPSLALNWALLLVPRTICVFHRVYDYHAIARLMRRGSAALTSSPVSVSLVWRTTHRLSVSTSPWLP